MPDLSGISAVDLYKAEAACDFLLRLHRKHEVLGGDLPAGLSALLTSIRTIRQDRASHRPADLADPVGRAAMTADLTAELASMPPESVSKNALSARQLMAVLEDPAVHLSDEQANAVARLAVEITRGNPVTITALALTDMLLNERWSDGPPPGYLMVTGMDEVSWQELTARRAWLLAAIAEAEPGSDHPGLRGAALALAAVLPELDARARNYAADPDSPRWCKCGFHCRGLAAINGHLDQFPDLDDDAHLEMTEPPVTLPVLRSARSRGTSRPSSS